VVGKKEGTLSSVGFLPSACVPDVSALMLIYCLYTCGPPNLVSCDAYLYYPALSFLFLVSDLIICYITGMGMARSSQCSL
jgi:hypothetical protein